MGNLDDVGDSMELPAYCIFRRLSDRQYEVTNREFVDALNWAYERKL